MYYYHEGHEDNEGYPRGTAFSRYETDPYKQGFQINFKSKVIETTVKSFVL